MRRRQLIEIIDQPWCPSALREGVTDYLRLIVSLGNPYRVIVEPLSRAFKEARSGGFVDLGAGAGGPWRRLGPSLERELGRPLDVLLTDLHPRRIPSLGREREMTGRYSIHPRPVDARSVPDELDGFRVLFSSFHHFPPEEARRVLADAVEARRGIAVMEMTKRSLVAVLLILTTPLFAFVVTPFMRPFSWVRLLLTYLVPIIPLVIAFDGIISCLRTYSPDELRTIVEGLPEDDYRWEIRELSAFPPAVIPVTLLVGVPRGLESSRRERHG